VRQCRGEPCWRASSAWLAAKAVSELCCGQGALAARRAQGGTVGNVSLPGISPPSGERMVTAPLWVCCAFIPSRCLILSPGFFTPEGLIDKYLFLVHT